MKNLVLVTILSFFATTVLSQSDKNVEDSQLKINFINPGLEYEFGIGKNQTIDLSAGLQFTASGTDNTFLYAFIPAFNAQYRYYYNFDRRLEKSKLIAGNSGNYVAASSTVFTGDVIIGNVQSGSGYAGFLGPVYGIQRTYKKGFNFNMEFGVGLYFAGDPNFDPVDLGFGPTVSFSIGWVLGKNK